MTINKELFSKRYWDSPPSWECPKCDSGRLMVRKDGQNSYEHGWSKDAHSHEAWDPDWIRRTFSWALECTNPACKHVVIVSGEEVLDWDVEDGPEGPEQVWKEYYSPKCFTDAPQLFRPNENVPEDIAETLNLAFQLFWVDPASCLNKIRTCVELILNAQKIRKSRISAGKRVPVSLHSRIQEFKTKNSETAEFLMALKWLGNEGSHSASKPKPIQKSDLLDAFELLEHALEELYSPKSKSLAAKAKQINKKRGR